MDLEHRACDPDAWTDRSLRSECDAVVSLMSWGNRHAACHSLQKATRGNAVGRRDSATHTTRRTPGPGSLRARRCAGRASVERLLHGRSSVAAVSDARARHPHACESILAAALA